MSSLKIFLCHATEDKLPVRVLYNRLIKDGFDVWLDEENLLPGQSWALEISKAIKNTDIILVCLSNKSVTKRGVVQKEIKLGLEEALLLPEGQIFIIPVRFEDCPMPAERLESLQWVNLFEENGYAKLLKALRLRDTFSNVLKEKVENITLSERENAILGFSVVPSQHVKLWGREGEIEKIIGELRNPKGKPVIAISGLGGMGKTSLAQATLELCKHEMLFETYIWESSKLEIMSGNQIVPTQPSFQLFPSLLNNILRKLGINTGGKSHDQLLSLLLMELERKKILIVIDNLEDAIDYRNIIANLETRLASSKSRFILTLRPQVSEFTEIYSINLQGLRESDCISFLRNEGSVRGLQFVAKLEEKYLRLISQAIGGAPLAGKLVISQLTRLTIATVLENLEEAKGEMESVYLFIYRKSWGLLSSHSRKVLLSMPIFPAPINKSAIEQVSTITGNELIGALAELIQLSMIEMNDAILDTKRKYSIHQLTRNFVQTELIEKWT
jgi:hypothetical protein